MILEWIFAYLCILFLMSRNSVALYCKENKNLHGFLGNKASYYVGMAGFSAIGLMCGAYLIITGTGLDNFIPVSICKKVVTVCYFAPFTYAFYLWLSDFKQCLREVN